MSDAIVTVNLNNLHGSALEYLEKNPIEVPRGMSINFAVHTNPTTGYTWQYESTDENAELFTVEKHYTQDDAPENWTGVPGITVFTLTGDSTGEGVFHIWKGHEWEGMDHFVTEFRFPIHVV